MTAIMGYCDPWSVAPGETVRFMVSCIGTETYEAVLVRLKQPDAGPLGTPFAPEPVPSRVSGSHPGVEQRLVVGSWAFVRPAPVLTELQSFTLLTCVWPTSPGRGRQALLGTWSQTMQSGFGLMLDERGCLELVLGSGPGGVTRLSGEIPLRNRRWYLVAGSFDAESGRIDLWQEPLEMLGFDTDQASHRQLESQVRLPSRSRQKLLMAACHAGDDGPIEHENIHTTCHFNGKLEAPRIARRALDRASILALVGGSPPKGLQEEIVGAWDFARLTSSETIVDIGPNRLDGRLINLPTRAVTGHRWTGEVMDWTRAPDQYGAIHFHDDDIVDACWEPSLAWTVPNDQRSGVYALHLKANEADFWVPFFVRPPRGEARSKVAFLASTATYIVYLNNKGRFASIATELYRGRLTVMDRIDMLLFEHPGMGLSTYDRHSDGSGVAYSSRWRPAQNFRPTGRHWNFNLDLFIIDWLEHEGGDYDVITDEDLHREGLNLLKPYRVVLTGSHPEYDSLQMLDTVQAYLRGGGRFMYMGGNGFYWRIAHHPTRSGVIEVRRAEGGVRAWDAEPGEYYMSFTGEYGGLWRRNGRAPQQLAGVGFIAQGFDACSYYRRLPAADDPRVAWMFAGVDGEILGDFGIEGGAAGLEIDAVDTKLGTPSHALVVARSENHSNSYELVAEEVLVPHGSTDAIINPDIHADITFFETPNGGAVWSTGSIAYAEALSHNGFNNTIARLTTNVLHRFKDERPFSMPEQPTPDQEPPSETNILKG